MKLLTNRLEEIIKEKEKTTFTHFKPTRDFFKKVGIGQKRFHQLVRNEVSMTFQEMIHLAAYFDITNVRELHHDTLDKEAHAKAIQKAKDYHKLF